MHALYEFGYPDEVDRFLTWMLGVTEGDPAAVQVLYGVADEPTIEEFELPHLEGYRASRLVRVGNAAYAQRQHDIYGELLDCAFLLHKHGGMISRELWGFLRAVVDRVCATWREPDQGIWDVCSGPRHFVYSKALCWVALDRGARLARERSLPAPIDAWLGTRDAILREMIDRDYDERLGAFTQAYGSDQLDAAALALLLRRVLPPDDPRLRSTVDRIAADLGAGGLLHRYARDNQSPTGVAPILSP